jgi:protein SCO1/2
MPAHPFRAARRRASPRARAAIVPVVLAGAILFAGCSSGSPSTAQTPATARASASGFEGAALPAGIRAQGFTLTDQQGRATSLAAYRGRVVVLGFVYSKCGATCVLVAQQIRGALDQLPKPAPVLLISAEPSDDTRASIARFLDEVSLTGRAEYLSGPREQLARLWRAYRITPPSTSRSAFERGASVLLVDGEGRERVLFGVEQLTPESLAHDIRKLAGEPTHP